MRRLLRRLAWLIARLVIVLLISFLVLARATAAPRDLQADFSSDRIEQSPAPLLLNLRPADLESHTDALLARLSNGESPADADELRRLGGATFPLILPRLGQLEPSLRLRVARLFLPVARRMLWKGSTEIHSDAEACTYLMDAWEERSVDFRPAIVARWVERLADRGSDNAMNSVIEYDTYGVRFMVEALPTVRTEADAVRAGRLLATLARVTGLPWLLPDASSPEDARALVERWRRWWALHESEYTVVRGPSRWSAMLKQTRLSQWVSLATRFSFGMTKDHREVLDVLRHCVPRSATILIGSFAGCLAALSLSGWRHRGLAGSPLRRAVHWALTSIPHVSLIAGFAVLLRSHSLWTTTLVAFVIIALLAPVSGAGGDKSLSLQQTDIASHLAYVWRFADHTWPLLLTFVFLLENAFCIDGIGKECVSAFRNRDLHLLMGLATVTAFAGLWVIEFASRKLSITRTPARKLSSES